MSEIHEITQSMHLTLKPSKCKSMSLSCGRPNICQFKVGETLLKTTKDAPEKFLGKHIFHGNKSKDIYDVVKSKVMEQIDNINSSHVRNEYKLRVYVQYSIPALRYLFTVNELTDTQLVCLDHLHTNSIKKWIGMAINGPTSAIIHSPGGLSIPKLSEMYLEAHTISFARCLVKGDDRVAHVINSKLARESTWKRKMQTFGSRQWNNFYQAANKSMSAINKMKSKWKAIKNNIKNELENYRTNEWRQRVQPLSVQGRMLELISDEKSDLTWRSIIYNLPTGVLSFAVRSCIDFLPTFTNLRTWGKRTNAKCKLCHNTQTLLHVLNHCAISLEQSRFTWRHNSILSYLTNELVKLNRNNCAIYADIPGHTITGGTVPPNILPTSQRPDLVLINNDTKSVHIFELTVPFETNISKAHKRKLDRYEMLQSEISNNSDFKCNLNCVEIGSRGLVTSDNIKRMRAAFGFVGAKLSSSCIKEVSRMSLLCSYTIWNARNEPQWDTAPYLRI